MKYFGMPLGMWLLFKGSFQRNMTSVLCFEKQTAAEITARAKRKYKEIIAMLPEFEKGDRFKMNLVNCVFFSSFCLNMEKRPSLMQLTEYYSKSMMTLPMRWFCRMSGKQKFSQRDIQSMKAAAALRAADRNPYSWNMEFHEYEDGSGYEVRFSHCGICTLMAELGLYDIVPAMCSLDYDMNKVSGTSDFVREYTLASGCSCCDCGYRKKKK
jgi:hypothetical protein